jgi:hypothetical protein
MNIKWRKRAGLVSAIGFMVLFLIMGLQPVAAQDKGEYPGESPAAPVPGAAPAEDKPTASFGVDILSQYIWRGFALSRQSAVLQPSLTVGYKGFSVNIWGNFDTSENAPAAFTPRTGANWNETDFTFGYTREVYKGDFIKSLNVNLGTIYYAYDKVLYPQGDSFEIYYGLAADFELLKLSIMGNSEVSHYPGTWLTVGISRVFELPYYKSTLELGNNYIFLFSRDNAAYPKTPLANPGSTNAFSGPLAGQLYATLNIPVHEYVTVSPKVGFWYGLGGNSTQLLRWASWDAQQNHVYGGLNVNFAF